MERLPTSPPLLLRLRALSAAPGARVALVLPALAGAVAAFLPLADHAGFEFALLLTVTSALAAPAAGVAAARLEVEGAADGRSRPGLAGVAASLWAIGALVVPTVVILVNGLRRTACDNGAGALWLLVLPVPGAALAAATGTFARLRTGSARRAAVLTGAVELAALGTGLHSLYDGPAFFLFDHFFGYWPGPLYDDSVPFSGALLAFRAATLLWAVAVLLACAGHGGPLRFRLSAALLAGLLVATSLAFGPRLGFRTTDASLEQALGGRRDVDRLEIVYPREWNEAAAEQLARDAAFRAWQVEQALGVRTRVRVWMYRSPEEKRRLVGAAHTSFAKPWRREIHVHASGYPHPVLRHELVHAIAAEHARGPFRVPGGLVPNSPLVEGFAVAFDADTDGPTLEQWARAMRDLDLAPDVSALLSSAGFYASAPSRAYSYAGAFLRHLGRQHGRERLFELYATGDLSRLGDPATLAAQFDRSLDAVTVGPAERAAAERRFARPSVFRRRCARETGALADEAREAAARGDGRTAIRLQERACELEPDDPGLLKALLTSALRANDGALVQKTAGALLAHPKADASLRAETLLELGDAAWKSGRTAEAEARFAEALQLPAEPGTRRGAFARLQAVRSASEPVLRPFFAAGDTGLAQLFRMNDRLQETPDDALTAYLLGRQLVQRDAVARGLALLERARGALGDAELERENLRLMVRALSGAHRCDDAQRAREALTSVGAGAGDDARAADWVERCRWETARGWKPMRAD